MNEYPEWLIEKVARVISNAEEEPEMVAFYRNVAIATIDALGFAPWGGETYWRSDIQWEAK